jgi:hypothetical protein
MGLSFTILPRHSLIIARYDGFASLDETRQKAALCAADPAFDPRMRHLVDLRALTGYERDFPKYFAMQAEVMDRFHNPRTSAIFVYLAPGRVAQEMAQMVRRSWEGLGSIVVRIVEEESDAIAILGLGVDRLEDLTKPLD